jgi:hypothetical protein
MSRTALADTFNVILLPGRHHHKQTKQEKNSDTRASDAKHHCHFALSSELLSLDGVIRRSSSSTSAKSSGGGHMNSRMFPECGCKNLKQEINHTAPHIKKIRRDMFVGIPTQVMLHGGTAYLLLISDPKDHYDILKEFSVLEVIMPSSWCPRMFHHQ